MGWRSLRRKSLMRPVESAWGSLIRPDKLTLNQRVQGSSPCAPTNEIKDLIGNTTGNGR
jgi:hypothetical protein